MERNAGWSIGILTTAATLVGAAAGVAGTLWVSTVQLDAALAAEERARRTDVYASYVDAADTYFDTQLALVEDPGDECIYRRSFEMEPDNAICMAYGTSTVEPSRRAYSKAYVNVVIYGTDATVRAATPLDEIVSAINPGGPLPVSSDAYQWQRGVGQELDDWLDNRAEIVDRYNAAARQFRLAMCREVTTNPERCNNAFADHL